MWSMLVVLVADATILCVYALCVEHTQKCIFLMKIKRYKTKAVKLITKHLFQQINFSNFTSLTFNVRVFLKYICASVKKRSYAQIKKKKVK